MAFQRPQIDDIQRQLRQRGVFADQRSTATSGALAVVAADLAAHEADTANPHAVTKAQVGLTNADDTSDVNKPVSTAQAAADAAVQAFAIQRGNHTGSQLAATISDFAATVRATVLTGLSTASTAVITAASTVLGALGQLQAQISALGTGSTLTADTDGALAANSDTRVATQKATKTYVDNAVTGLWDVKGDVDCSANPNYPAASKGDAHAVSVAGKIGGASGVSVDIGDVFVAKADNAGGTQAAVGTSWFVLEHNLVGVLLAANNLSDLVSASAARTNLGLGTLSTQSGTFSGTSSGTNTGDETAATVATLLHGATSKSAIVDADEVNGTDSASGFSLIRTTWAQVKTYLFGTGTGSTDVGFRNVPQNSKSAAYTTVAADAGKHIFHPAADVTARTFTIDSNANVAYPIGTAITFVNEHGAGVVTIAITTDTMRLAGAGTTGSRTLAADGIATALKITTTSWIISGTGLT